MKKYTLIIALFSIAAFYGCGTLSGTAAAPELRTYEKIIEAPGQKKDQLFINVNSWMVESFTSAKSVIEFTDKEAGKVMGNYSFNYYEFPYYFNVKQVLDVEVKDEKIKVRFSNPEFLTTGTATQKYYDTVYRPLKTEVGVTKARASWEATVLNLEEYLKTKKSW